MAVNYEAKKENYFTEKKKAILITLLVILIGSFLYFGIDGIGNSKMMESQKLDQSLFENMKLKVAFNDEGQMKIFALAQNNRLAALKAMEGNAIPETGSIVIGYTEAMMMKDEKLFSKPGDIITSLFGADFKVEGTLAKTGMMADYFHFISEKRFSEVEGSENRAFIRIVGSSPKLVYSYYQSDDLFSDADFEEGETANYQNQIINGKEHYPILLGKKEAEMMKEEKMFSKAGDRLKLFDKDFIVAGILKETNTGLDYIHIIPLFNDELGE